MHAARLATIALLLTALSSSALTVGPEIPVTDVAIEPAPDLREAPLSAANGDGFLVVWYDRRGGAAEVRAARVSRDGALLDAQSRLVASNAGAVTSVASNGRDYLIAYNCSRSVLSDICLARVDASNGAVVQASAIDGTNGALAANGNGYFVVYQHGMPGAVQPVSGVALREDGTPSGPPFRIAASAFAPAVAASRTGFFVVWSTFAHLEGVLVSDSRVVGTPQQLTSAAPSWGPAAFGWAVASDGDAFLVAWQQNTGVVGTAYTTDLRVRPVSPGGVAGAPRTVVEANAWQPALAWTGTEYLLTYTHSTTPARAPYLVGSANGDVRALALSSAGEPRGTPANYAAGTGRETASTVAAAGGAALVAWENLHRQDAAHVQARLAGREATLIVSTAATWQQNVTLSRTASQTLVAWEEVAGPEQLSRVMLHQYEANVGRRLGRETFRVQASNRHQRRPALGSGLVAWVEEEPEGSGASVWYQGLNHVGYESLKPIGSAARIANAARGSRLAVLMYHVFHALVWTAPDGRLETAERSLIARIGYDPTSWFVTNEPAVNPASAGYSPSLSAWPLVAYNYLVTPQPCPDICPARYGIRATTHGARFPQKAIDIAPPGATAPDVVAGSESDFFIFWSTEEGGTFVQRVTTGGGIAAAVGAPRKVHDAAFHDASIGRNDELLVVARERDRFVFLRFDRNFNLLETVPFHARLASGKIQLSSDRNTSPMMAYAAAPTNDGASSRVVIRLIEDDLPQPKRRSAR